MVIYAVDDERLNLEALVRILKEARPGAEVKDFLSPAELLNEMADRDEKPDVVFMDIEMPEMTGLELAVRIKNISPETRIVFVTGYSEYAVDAFKVHASGYILKPVTLERIQEELAHMEGGSEDEQKTQPGKLKVRCFGAFEVFYNGEPLEFKRSKAKEMLAFLIDRKGDLCTGGELINALWEDNSDLDSKKAYLRTITSELRSVLTSVGMEDVLIRKHQMWGVRTNLLDCDYYRMLAGDPEAVNSYHGKYMSRYSWAEPTTADIFFKEN